MATLTYLIKVDGTDITSYLKADGGYQVSYEELWSEANRNMAGDLKATFIATVPKIALQFKQLTKAEMSTILGLLDGHTMSIQWWEENTDTYLTADFYRSTVTTAIRD